MSDILLLKNIIIYNIKSMYSIIDSEISPATLLGQRAILLIKNRLLRRQGRLQSRSREICYGSIRKLIYMFFFYYFKLII